MKRFTKVCLIIALVFVVLGIGCFIVGGILGANPLQAFKEAADSINYTKNFDKDYDIEDFTLEKECDADSFQNLTIHMELGSVVIKPVSSDSCRVWVDKGSFTRSLEVTTKGKELKIDESVYDNYWRFPFFHTEFFSFLKERNLGNCTKVIVELPQKQSYSINGTLDMGAMKLYDLTLSEMVLNIEAGSVYSEGTITGDYVEVTVDMGVAHLDQVKCNKVVAHVDMGEISLDSVQANTLKAEADMGKIDLSRIKAKNLEADCSMGNIRLKFLGEPEDYDITYEVDMGNVNLDDYRAEQVRSAKYTAELNCDMGNIDVSFLHESE